MTNQFLPCAGRHLRAAAVGHLRRRVIRFTINLILASITLATQCAPPSSCLDMTAVTEAILSSSRNSVWTCTANDLT